MGRLPPDADLRPLHDFLAAEPELNSVPLMLVERVLAAPAERDQLSAFVVESGGAIASAAVRMAFPKLALSAQGGEADRRRLAELVAEAMPDLPCVLGPVPAPEAFAARWAELTGHPGHPGMAQRLHRLASLAEPAGVPGGMRLAAEGDRELAYQWLTAFEVEAWHGVSRPEEERRAWAGRLIEARQLCLWEDGDPVALAGVRLQEADGIARIGPVYTPPGRRRQGYGSAVTAAASRHALDLGCRGCCLFTDLDNPTSNHIYAEIGYRPLADFSEIWFDLGLG